MRFHPQFKEYRSDKNGVIRCRRWWWRWHVTVDGYDQTSPYIRAMWKSGLRRMPRDASVKRILSLGLGAGGQLSLLRKRFPNAVITVIEWDPVMVQIAEQLHLYTPDSRIAMMVGDARVIVPTLTDVYDLIIIDLFRGHEPSPALETPSFRDALIARLAARGYLLLNVFEKKQLLSLFDTALSRHRMWRFRYNTVALYRPFGLGKAGDPLPIEYAHYKQSREYLRGDWDSRARAELVGAPPCLGVRWWHGPLCFEGYETDVEPIIAPGERRMVIWQPLTRLDKPKSWHRSFIQMNFRRTGFAEITNERYWETWTAHALRHRRRWLRQTAYEMGEADDAEFLHAYRQATSLPRYLHTSFAKTVKRRRVMHGNAVHLFSARERKTGRVVAGLAVLDTPDALHSTHLISFIHPDTTESSVGTGLIDYWFQHCGKQGIRFLNFGVFWTFGDSWSWRGFSKFKSQFGIRYIHRPNPLVKFVERSEGVTPPRG